MPFTPFNMTDPLFAEKLNSRFDELIADLELETGLPIGTLLPFSGTVAPSQWVLCDGSAINRVDHPELFDLVGVTYGFGDGHSTFNLPDLRGRAVVGVGTGSGLTARSLGDSFGTETHTLTVDEMASHTHTVANLVLASLVSAGGAVPSGIKAVTLDSAGGGQAHNNMQPSLVLNWIIRG